jgi:8-oxo-dGTP pyrophosphatase MutT (NUDIX family)
MNADELRRRLAARPRLSLRLDGYREAAVLVPLVVEPDATRLVFTLRPDSLPTHAGQISFPGGKRDPDDCDAEACALREAREELGIDTGPADVLGLLDDVPTPTGFMITPVVARLPGPLLLSPSEIEVAEVFTPSLDELARPERHAMKGRVTFLGVEYEMHEYQWNQHRIWGATARMVYQLFALLRKDEGPGR